MTKKNWNENDIEKTLSELPPVKDSQSKDALFQAIEKRSEKVSLSRTFNKRKRSWVLPTLGSVAAIFIILLVIPSFINNNSQMSMDEANNSAQNMETSSVNSEEDKASTFTVENSGNENQESRSDTENDGTPAISEDSSDENESEISEDNDRDASSMNVENEVYEEESNEEDVTEQEMEEVEVLTPSVFVAQLFTMEESGLSYDIAAIRPTESNDGSSIEEVLISSLQASDPTTRNVMDSLLKVSVDGQSSKSVHLDFQDGHELESLSSGEHEGLRLMFQEIFTVYGIDEVELSVEGEPGLTFGQQGEEEILPIDLFNRGYYTYEEAGEIYLVSARVVGEQMRTDSGKALTYQETVERMATLSTDNVYTSPVPSFVEVVNFKFGDRFAEVVYEKDELETEDQLEQMTVFYDSLILTAEPFSIDTLRITNESTGETKEVDLN